MKDKYISFLNDLFYYDSLQGFVQKIVKYIFEQVLTEVSYEKRYKRYKLVC